MPNWCENRATVTAPDAASATALFQALAAGHNYLGVENVICTQPGAPATASTNNMAEWTDRAMDGRIWLAGQAIEMSFASRWEPPVAFYHALMAHGFSVEALFLETGMAFCGSWSAGALSRVQYTDRSHIPPAIEREWGAELFDWIFE